MVYRICFCIRQPWALHTLGKHLFQILQLIEFSSYWWRDFLEIHQFHSMLVYHLYYQNFDCRKTWVFEFLMLHHNRDQASRNSHNSLQGFHLRIYFIFHTFSQLKVSYNLHLEMSICYTALCDRYFSNRGIQDHQQLSISLDHSHLLGQSPR